jgi:Fe2+ transport system protein FeoA
MQHPQPAIPLTQLPLGAAATVVAVRLQGAERRRLLDLGVVPGARVEALFDSVLGRPRAYRIRGTMLALRTDQSDAIEVLPA